MEIIQANSMLELVKICFLVNSDKNLGKLAKINLPPRMICERSASVQCVVAWLLADTTVPS